MEIDHAAAAKHQAGFAQGAGQRLHCIFQRLPGRRLQRAEVAMRRITVEANGH